jgi:hypothetical protein
MQKKKKRIKYINRKYIIIPLYFFKKESVFLIFSFAGANDFWIFFCILFLKHSGFCADGDFLERARLFIYWER